MRAGYSSGIYFLPCSTSAYGLFLKYLIILRNTEAFFFVTIKNGGASDTFSVFELKSPFSSLVVIDCTIFDTVLCFPIATPIAFFFV